MKSMKKTIISIMTAGIIAAAMNLSVSAEDFEFDMAKARWTYGKGTTYQCFTRLDNERRDKNNFDPRWITPDTEVHVTYQTEGDIESAPAILQVQTWTGDLVDSTEDKFVDVQPAEWDEDSAVYKYADIVAAWGDDSFGTVYSFHIKDNEINPLMLTSMTFTNCDIPDEAIIEGVTGGIVTENGKEVIIETQPVETEIAAVTEANDEKNETTAESASAANSESESSKIDSEDENEQSSVNPVIIAIVAGGIAVITAAAIIIAKVLGSKRKNKGWH